MNRLFTLGGLVASLVLIAFGIGAIVVGASGHSEVRDTIKLERIVGTPDMTPAVIRAEARRARLTGVELPDCDVADKPIDTGSRAKCFAKYIRIHTLEATGGRTYSEMPRYLGKNGQPTNDEKSAATNPQSGKPMDNPQRGIWVTSTALSTALNTSYFAEQVSVFSIVMGIALLLTGIGFLVLTLGVLRRGTASAATPEAR
ncbi:MAG: hypothetical protein QOE65_599 [Solirubrobacteraceae bacterium]|jgi:hypothetical protein|nr:hypothetical protein [Solirubrobacteraceae bacterium]